MNNNELLQRAIQSAQSGDRANAAQLLARVVQTHPDEREAWWWLAQVLETPAQRDYCDARWRALDARSETVIRSHETLETTPKRMIDAEQRSEPVPPIVVQAPASAETLIDAPARKPSPPRWTPLAIRLGAAAILVVALMAAVAFLRPFIRLPLAWERALPPGVLPALAPDEIDSYRRQARQMMLGGNYTEGLTLYDRVIASDPDRGEDYFRRAQTYQALNNGERIENVYLERTTLALADVNHAILLGPVTGDYFALRSSLLTAMASLQMRRSDALVFIQAALADEQLALNLGTADNGALVWLPHLMVLAGDCSGAADVAQQTLQDWSYDQTTSDLSADLAESSLCLGDLDSALANIQVSRQQSDTEDNLLLHAWILYERGELDAALALLDASISAAPDYGGQRYYVRALIKLDQGRSVDAATDLDAGTSRTWDRGGIYLYVKGRLAIQRGDGQTGWAQIQQSEASLPLRLSLFRQRLNAELLQAGIPSLEDKTTATFDPTVPSVWPAPLDLPVDRRAPLNPGLGINLSSGQGPLLSYNGLNRSYHLIPDVAVPPGQVERLVFQVLPLLGVGVTDFEIDVWDQKANTWSIGRADASGTFIVTDPDAFISPSGDVFWMVVNRSGEKRQIVRMGVTLMIRDAQGQEIQVGLPYPPTNTP